MRHIGERIKEPSTGLGLSQYDPAKVVWLSYIQIGLHETNKAQSSFDGLQEIDLKATNDFLVSGAALDFASSQLSDIEHLNQFKVVEQLSQEYKNISSIFIEAFLNKRQIQKLPS